jgi:hypothetical protein
MLCLPTASGCHFSLKRRLRNVAVFWAALSQGNQLADASTYNGYGVQDMAGKEIFG